MVMVTAAAIVQPVLSILSTPGYTWRHLVDADLSCHMVLGPTCRFLPYTVKSFHSSFHTNNMGGNYSDEISMNESVSIKEELV